MHRKYLVILEGPDRVGKSTFAKKFAEKNQYFLLSQPNSLGPLGFLRDIVKFDLTIDNFSRQLLHAVSHTWDTHLFNEYDHIIMDRSYISGLIYGRGTGLSEEQLDILREVHRSIHSEILTKNNFKILIVNFSPSEPFGEKDDSIYERLLGWKMLRDTYDEYFMSGIRIFDGSEIIRIFAPFGDEEYDYQVFQSLVFDNLKEY